MIFRQAFHRYSILILHGTTIFPTRFPRIAWLVAGLAIACFAPALARADGVPIVVERYDADLGPRDAAAIVRGDFLE